MSAFGTASTPAPSETPTNAPAFSPISRLALISSPTKTRAAEAHAKKATKATTRPAATGSATSAAVPETAPKGAAGSALATTGRRAAATASPTCAGTPPEETATT